MTSAEILENRVTYLRRRQKLTIHARINIRTPWLRQLKQSGQMTGTKYCEVTSQNCKYLVKTNRFMPAS